MTTSMPARHGELFPTLANILPQLVNGPPCPPNVSPADVHFPCLNVPASLGFLTNHRVANSHIFGLRECPTGPRAIDETRRRGALRPKCERRTCPYEFNEPQGRRCSWHRLIGG